jgi:hypothetical protein
MTPVRKPELTQADWIQWRQDASEAISDIKKKYKLGEKVEVNDDLYKRAMPFLLSLFHDKCAYCESLITNTHPGDVEHYRPKGRLKDIDGRIVKITVNGKEFDHPGYWWLCYDWTNLLPSCIDCNRRRNHGEELTAAGKADIFPIGGKRAGSPNDPLPAEDALLLNPSEDGFDPDAHFEFKPDGKIATKSKRAELSCELLGLNLREALTKQRGETYVSAMDAFSTFVGKLMSVLDPNAPISDAEKRSRERINDMWEGRTPHTAFARLALSTAQQALAKRNVTINLPLPTG